MALVSVHKISEAFGISARKVQQLVLEGMPREVHGQYDLAKCMLWYARYLHQKACGCPGPCEGPERRSLTILRRARERLHKELVELAPHLKASDAQAIRNRLVEAVDAVFLPLDRLEEQALERILARRSK